METMSDGDGYNFCGNGWGWLDFPLPCRSLFNNPKPSFQGQVILTLNIPEMATDTAIVTMEGK